MIMIKDDIERSGGEGIIDSIDKEKYESSTTQQLNSSTLATGQRKWI
tara:strand:- start:183 stop:323 length:141 start_codon:yes stop_codon:yes gene_type:complete